METEYELYEIILLKKNSSNKRYNIYIIRYYR